MPIFRGVPAVSEFQDATVNELEDLIDQEAEARQAGDAALQSNIDSEVSTRQSADTTLQSNIDLKADKDNPVFTGNVAIETGGVGSFNLVVPDTDITKTLTLPDEDGTVITDVSDKLGKVVQFASKSSSTIASTTSLSFIQYTPLDISFTPKFANSLIVVETVIRSVVKSPDPALAGGAVTITLNGNPLIDNYNDGGGSITSFVRQSGTLFSNIVTKTVYTSSDISTLNFGVGFSAHSTSTHTINNDSNNSQFDLSGKAPESIITIMEIAQ